MIEIRHLNKTYRTAEKDIVALEDINLTIRDGEIFGIIGLSGAGKSTLVRCINLLEQPSAGEVIVDGESITALPRRELLKLRRSIGMIFQGFNLLEQRSVLRNVCFPLEIAGVKKKEARERAMELLSLVGLADRAEAYPSQLSGGQKQRVAIARALATKPKYLLCDEATSALDPTTTRAILELLRQINETLGVTIIVITHEMKVIDQICDRVAVIDHSRIAEEGKVSEVFTNPRSRIARDLIIPRERTVLETEGGKRLRLTFDGEMRIDAQDWAVREIHVKLKKGSNVNWIRDLVLDSEYQLVGGRGSYKGKDSLWFFKQDRMYADFSVTMRDSSKLMSFLGRRQCDYLDPRFDTPMPDSVSRLMSNVTMSANPLVNDEAYWQQHRPYELSEKESNIYKMVWTGETFDGLGSMAPGEQFSYLRYLDSCERRGTFLTDIIYFASAEE